MAAMTSRMSRALISHENFPLVVIIAVMVIVLSSTNLLAPVARILTALVSRLHLNIVIIGGKRANAEANGTVSGLFFHPGMCMFVYILFK
jgi:hypothetical protein